MANDPETRAIWPGVKAMKAKGCAAAGQKMKLMPRQTIEWA